MIIWLASYPRSGNTLLRIILKSVFELPSFSKHGDADDIGADSRLSDAVGHRVLAGDWAEEYQPMRSSPEMHFVKTHDAPDDDGKAIYVVRDGRSTCQSFHHYLRDFSKRDAIFLTDVIAGFTPFGSWSDHLADWNPQHRRETLLVKYEDLIADPKPQIERIAEFLGRTPLHNWKNNFAKLQKLNARFFRVGKNDSPPELGNNDAAIFWELHGHWMKQLGYPCQDPPAQSAYRVWISKKERQFYELRSRTADAESQMLEQSRQHHSAQKQFAIALQEKNEKSDQLTAAVGELNTRLRMLLTSKLLHLGWFVGLGRTPYWNDPAADELTDLIDALRSADVPQPTLATSEMETALRHLLAKGFRPKVVLDVGAAKGYWSLLAGGLWKQAEFFMIDPLPVSEPDLKIICEDPRFHYLLLAVGDRPAEIKMKIASDPDSSSLLIPPDSKNFQTVHVRTIDELLDSGRIKQPDLIKIDVQGFELKVLLGGAKLFDHAEVFIIEANFFEFMPGCPRLDELMRFMADRGFYPFDFAGFLRRPFEDDLGQVDVVFVSRKSSLVASNRWLKDLPMPIPPQNISVIICTKDPRPDIFARVLESLDRQTISKDLFEVIVVDNASQPPLDLKVKVVREPTAGLGRARCTGIAQATGQLLVFVDDDNFLAPDYLERALEISQRESSVGLFGGICEAELEVPIAKWKQPVLPYLGIRNEGDQPITKLADRWGKWEPIGAGMVARRVVAERFVKMFEESADARALGRAGSSLLSGEDSLMARAAFREGFACSYQPALRLTHYLRASRLTVRYMSQVLEGHGRSFVLLQRAIGKPTPVMKLRSVIALLLYRLKDVGLAGFIIWRWEIGYAKEAKRASHAP